MSKLETNTIDTVSGTNTLTIGSSNTSTIAFKSGASFTGLGNYAIQKIDKYTYGTEVNIANTASTYSDIAGGNTINFTPTSTNDIIFLIGQNTLQYSATNGAGLGFTQGTSSTLSSSDTKIAVTGQHSEYNTASALYSISNIQATVTGLSASTTYYFDMHGVVYYGGGTQFTKFNKVSIPSGTGADAMHSVIGIHYKYIG